MTRFSVAVAALLVAAGVTAAAASTRNSAVRPYSSAATRSPLLTRQAHIQAAALRPITTPTALEDNPRPNFGHAREWNHPRPFQSINPKLASDGNGSWLALWYSFEDWPAFPPFSISNDSGRSWSPWSWFALEFADVVSDGDGDWLAVGGGRGEGHGWVPQIQLVRSSGEASQWSEPKAIADIPTPNNGGCYAYITGLALGRSRSGALAVTWTQRTEWCSDEEDQVLRGPYAIRSLDNGETWTLPQRLNDGLVANASRPKLVSLGTNGWLLSHDGVSSLLRSTDDGLTWTVPDPGGLGEHYFGWENDLACDSTSKCVAVFTRYRPSEDPWRSDIEIVARTSLDAGTTWSDAVLVSHDEMAPARTPAIATDDEGLWTAIWVSSHSAYERTGPDANLLQASSTDLGKTWSAAGVLTESAAGDGWLRDDPPVIAHDAGTWMAMWGVTADFGNTADAGTEPRFALAYPNCGDGVLDDFEACDDGNVLDGDGCDSNCSATGCGNGAVSAAEECDDGNDRDDDACSPLCTIARCGDGYVRDRLEQCDDGNDEDGDACTNACTIARCGDGVLKLGVEECDDGNTVGEDACTSICTVAGCGDGYVQHGVEECDDANPNTQDHCPAGCRYARCGDGYVWLGVEACDPAAPGGPACDERCGAALCGDANGDGEHTVTDAVTILSRAVGKPVVCPLKTCDVDGNLRVGAIDALITLGMSVGLPYPTACEEGSWLVIRLQDTREFAEVRVRIDTSGAPVTLMSRDNAAVCEPLVPGILFAGDVSGANLIIGMIASSGIVGPVDLGRCRVRMNGDVDPSQFHYELEYVADRTGQEMRPLPTIVVRGATP